MGNESAYFHFLNLVRARRAWDGGWCGVVGPFLVARLFFLCLDRRGCGESEVGNFWG